MEFSKERYEAVDCGLNWNWFNKKGRSKILRGVALI